MNKSIHWKETKKITIFIPTTRRYRVVAMAKQIANLEQIAIHDIDVLVAIDNNKLTKRYVETVYKKHVKFPLKIHHTNLPPIGEIYIQKRRERIANVLNQAKRLIPEDSDFVFMLEDDTDFPKDTLVKLLTNYNNFTNAKVKVGIVSGIQVGRWGYRMLGAWLCDNYKDPKVMVTVPFSRKHIFNEVDAAGLYCFITPRKLFKGGNFEANFFGPDVNFGLELRRKGYRNFIDWTIETGHVTRQYIYRPDEKVESIRFEKDESGKWNKVNLDKNKNEKRS